MSAQTDFYLTLDRCAGLTMDAACAARSAGHKPLPLPHRIRLNSITRKLESAQDELFRLRSDPWASASSARQPQLELL